MARRLIPIWHCINVVTLALSSLLLAACSGATVLATEPQTQIVPAATPSPIAHLHTPTGITIVAVTRGVPTATPTCTPAPAGATKTMVLQGDIYDAGLGLDHRLSQATLEWQFVAADWQTYNGQITVPTNGRYRLPLPVRPAARTGVGDEVIITAHAPGYWPSTAHIYTNQLNAYGSHLNFGLVSNSGPGPTLPGDLGTIQLHGIVYNVARGTRSPIANATVWIVNNSVVQPDTQLEATTDLSGTFTIPLGLHTTDRLDFTIAAAGYLTSTFSQQAQDLTSGKPLTIGLRPAPNAQ